MPKPATDPIEKPIEKPLEKTSPVKKRDHWKLMPLASKMNPENKVKRLGYFPLKAKEQAKDSARETS